MKENGLANSWIDSIKPSSSQNISSNHYNSIHSTSESKHTHTNKTDQPENSCNLTAQSLLEFVHRGMMLEDNDFL